MLFPIGDLGVSECAHAAPFDFLTVFALIDGGTTQELHLQRLLSGITSWLDPPEAVVGAIKSGSTFSR